MPAFYRVVVENEWSEWGGPSTGTQYDMKNACPHCGTGAVPVGPLFLARLRVPRHLVWATLSEVLVADEFAQALEDMGTHCLAEVRHRRTGQVLPVKGLRAEAVLPPFSSRTSGYARYRPCPECGRDGFFDAGPPEPDTAGKLHLVYEGLDPSYLEKNVLWTYEGFGRSALRSPFEDSVIAKPIHVLSQRVVDWLKEHGAKGLLFAPATLT